MSDHNVRDTRDEGSETTTGASDSGGDRRHFWNAKHFTHTVSLFLMAIATLGSSWSGFQASLWSGIQAFGLADAMKLGRTAAEERVVANQHRNLDAVIFMEYVRAMSSDSHKLSEFVLDRVRPEAKPAMTAWIATRPMQTPNAPASPFVMAEYQLKEEQDAAKHDSESAALHDAAQKANANGDNYTLLAMLFAIALFLAGLVTGFDESRKRWIVVIMSVALILFSSVMLSGLPVAHRG